MASQLLASGGNFTISVIVIRTLGIEEFGRFSIALLFITIIRNFLEGTVLNPLAALTPKLHGTSIRAYRGFILANAAAFGIVSSFLIVALAVPLGSAIGSPWLPQIALALACAIFSGSIADFLRRYQFVVAQPVKAFTIDCVRFLLQLGLISSLAVFSFTPFDSGTALYALALANLVASLTGFMFFGSLSWQPRLNAIMWPRHWNFIRWLGPGVILETLLSNAPLFAANIILGEAALGLVRVAQQITSILNMPMYALQQVLPSIAATRLKVAGYTAMVHLLRRTGYAMAATSILLGLVVVLASGPIADLMAIDAPSRLAVLLGLFMLVNIINAVRFPSMVFVNTVEDPTANFVAATVGATISVGLSFFLIPYLGEIAVPVIIIVIALAIWLTLALWRRWKYPPAVHSPASNRAGSSGNV